MELLGRKETMLRIRSLTICGATKVSGNELGLLSNSNCFCFWARAFEISDADRLHDLDKNSIGSFGVCGWGIDGKDNAAFSSPSPSTFSSPNKEPLFQAE